MRQFETQETDSNGRPIYYVGAGEIQPGGVVICYRKTYINPKNTDIVHKQQGDHELIYLYNKSTANNDAVAEIINQMATTKGTIKIYGCDRIPSMVSCRIGRTRWTHIVRFTDYFIGMGDRMAKALLAAIQSNDELKQRLVTD